MEDQMRRLQENFPLFQPFKCELLAAGGDEVQDGVVRAADGGGLLGFLKILAKIPK